ncbi:MAG: AMP-binding protein [Streptosporangiaceae bacterium]
MSILELADKAGYRAALIDATDATVTAWPRFAWTVRAAAHGLGRRGLAEGDTAGVFVPDAASAAIAVNAIRAAGAAACLIGPDASPADIAARLNACGARLLITSAPLAELATEGADRSRVRQVIAFGEAAGTTPFSSLLESARHGQPDEHGLVDEPGRPEVDGRADQHGLAAQDSGPGPGSAGELTHRDVVVAAPPCGDGQAYTSLLDLTLLTGATLVAAPLRLVTAAMRVYKGTAVIVPRGTHVPGVPPDRVFPVALSPLAREPGITSARTRWRLGGDGLFLRPRDGCGSGGEPGGPDQGDDDQQAAHVEDGGEAERGCDAVSDHVLRLGERAQTRQRVAGRMPVRGAVHRHQHAEAQGAAHQLEHVHQAGRGPGVRRWYAGQ